MFLPKYILDVFSQKVNLSIFYTQNLESGFQRDHVQPGNHSPRLAGRANQGFLSFQGNTMPEPKSMLEVTIEANNLVSLAAAKELYTASMESLCGGDRPFINDQVSKEIVSLMQDHKNTWFPEGFSFHYN